MCECLDELNEELHQKGSKLFFFKGVPEEVIKKLITSDKSIGGVFMNMDYTPFARRRANSIKSVCEKNSVLFTCLEDFMLTGANKVLKDDGQPYVKYTPYYRAAKKIKIREVTKNKYTNYVGRKYKPTDEFFGDIHKFYKKNPDIAVHGGRSQALKILQNIKQFDGYNNTRDVPKVETTHLSAYLKFNCVSIREVHSTFKNKLKNTNKLFAQLYWRDFYMMILYWYPHSMNNPMKLNYYIDWINNPALFDKWKSGETGIPIIDAGMRQMNKIGWMHNRVRMIVANFLVKILHINWQQGEKYFAQCLVDYDPCLNNMNWQWNSSTGTDSQPFFRVFNPWRQTEKFDRECEYIKKWVPELREVPNGDVLKWDIKCVDYKHTGYPSPIVTDFKKEVKKTLNMYKKRRTQE
jgi:deoxyribodipyrimidine photo-lyase